MRNRFEFLGPVFHYFGSLLIVLGGLLLIPVAVRQIYEHLGHAEVSTLCYIFPSGLSFTLGWLFKRWGRTAALSRKGAMLVCAMAWTFLSVIAAIPFVMALGVSYLDAYFETVSGFTTTGITMLTGLDGMPRSILFWRSLLQWLGGLGILTFFLMVIGGGGSSHRLFSAEAHKIFSKRPAPGIYHTLKILWGIYTLFTVLVMVLLFIAGASVFDAVVHAFTCISTGGYSPYDASIGYFKEAGYANYIAIEYIIILGMLLGGINFLIHFRVLTGGFNALWNNFEIRLWWVILGMGTFLVWFNHSMAFGFRDIESSFRTSLFQIVAIATTTGYGTEEIGGNFFPALSMQIFLILMIIGGCVGSTGGGIKVLRIGVLLKMVNRQVRRAILGNRTTNVLLVDGEDIDSEEITRIAALFFAWLSLLAVGAAITAIFAPYLGPLESASGMFSALGNIGPCYITVEEMTQLSPVIKITYIFGMLAGRLEILPILMLFNRWTWR